VTGRVGRAVLWTARPTSKTGGPRPPESGSDPPYGSYHALVGRLLRNACITS
jgi:hypothetical protein